MESIKKKPIHISVDEDLKADAEQLFDELGLNMTTAITVFLKQSVTKQAIPFKIENIKSIERCSKYECTWGIYFCR